jgi:hypothetical protein
MAEVIATPLTELHAPEFRGHRMLVGWSIVALVGFVLLAIGVAVDPARTWLSYLMAFTFAFTTVVGGLILLLISYAANARWMSVARRTMEAVMLPLPALVVLFVPILFGLKWLYPWHTPPAGTPPHELAVYEHRSPYLNTTAFAIRGFVYFAVLLVPGMLLRRWSLRRDRNGVANHIDPVEEMYRERKFSSVMLPLVGLAFSFAIIDWVMSLNGIWYSTMYPVILFGGGFLAAIGTVTVLTERVWAHQGTSVLTQNHFHALGRMQFAFVVFWGYVSYFQLMLIRIANKPDEVTFYLARIDGAWRVFAWILVLGQFVLPFLVLMPKSLKFRPHAMAITGGWLLAMHLFDIYWQVIPSHVQGEQVLHWLDIGALAAVVGTCLAVAAWRQHRVPIIAERDPFLPTGALYRSPL